MTPLRASHTVSHIHGQRPYLRVSGFARAHNDQRGQSRAFLFGRRVRGAASGGALLREIRRWRTTTTKPPVVDDSVCLGARCVSVICSSESATVRINLQHVRNALQLTVDVVPNPWHSNH